MSANIRIKAVIFDLDGTIYNKKRLKYFFIWLFICRLKTLTNYLKIRKEIEGKTFENQDEFNAYVISELSNRCAISAQQCELFLEKFKIGFISTLKRHYQAENHIIKVINHFSEQNTPIACLSDYAFVKERLLALNIDISKFELIKSSEEYGALKPSPKSFMAIAKELNVEPEQVLVIGDREDTDGKGAASSHMQFIKYPENFQILNQIMTHAKS